MWDFEQAPDNLRRLVPMAYAGGWVAFVYPGGAAEIVESLMMRCKAYGFSVVRYDIENGGVVLAGPHPRDIPR